MVSLPHNYHSKDQLFEFRRKQLIAPLSESDWISIGTDPDSDQHDFNRIRNSRETAIFSFIHICIIFIFIYSYLHQILQWFKEHVSIFTHVNTKTWQWPGKLTKPELQFINHKRYTPTCLNTHTNVYPHQA